MPLRKSPSTPFSVQLGDNARQPLQESIVTRSIGFFGELAASPQTRKRKVTSSHPVVPATRTGRLGNLVTSFAFFPFAGCVVSFSTFPFSWQWRLEAA